MADTSTVIDKLWELGQQECFTYADRMGLATDLGTRQMWRYRMQGYLRALEVVQLITVEEGKVAYAYFIARAMRKERGKGE